MVGWDPTLNAFINICNYDTMSIKLRFSLLRMRISITDLILNEIPSCDISFDLDDCDNVLRIESK
jgi:hypothetical protein